MGVYITPAPEVSALPDDSAATLGDYGRLDLGYVINRIAANSRNLRFPYQLAHII